MDGRLGARRTGHLNQDQVVQVQVRWHPGPSRRLSRRRRRKSLLAFLCGRSSSHKHPQHQSARHPRHPPRPLLPRQRSWPRCCMILLARRRTKCRSRRETLLRLCKKRTMVSSFSVPYYRKTGPSRNTNYLQDGGLPRVVTSRRGYRRHMLRNRSRPLRRLRLLGHPHQPLRQPTARTSRCPRRSVQLLERSLPAFSRVTPA